MSDNLYFSNRGPIMGKISTMIRIIIYDNNNYWKKVDKIQYVIKHVI